MLAGHDDGAAGSTNRIGHIALIQPHPFLSDAVDVRGGGHLGQPPAVSADRVTRMIVGHDEENIRPLGGIDIACQADKQQAGRKSSDHQGVFQYQASRIIDTIVTDQFSHRSVSRIVVEAGVAATVRQDCAQASAASSRTHDRPGVSVADVAVGQGLAELGHSGVGDLGPESEQ